MWHGRLGHARCCGQQHLLFWRGVASRLRMGETPMPRDKRHPNPIRCRTTLRPSAARLYPPSSTLTTRPAQCCSATDTKQVGEIMKRAYEARQSGALPLKHFTTLNTAAQLQRIRLKSARLSKTATALLNEIARASDGKLRFLRWAMYGNNQPQHPIQRIPSQEREVVWEAIKNRAPKISAMAA